MHGNHVVKMLKNHSISRLLHMPWSRFLLEKPWRHAAALWAVLALLLAPQWAVASGTLAPPAPVQQALASATLAGEGQMRFWGLRIYDARLWVQPRFEPSAFDRLPLALELTYHRAFSGAAIAQRSIEEIQRQVPLSSEQSERWQRTLSRWIPDVQPGDRLTGLYQPGSGMRLWLGERDLGVVHDAELARLFFGIWLSPRTSEPGLRGALLGRVVERAP